MTPKTNQAIKKMLADTKRDLTEFILSLRKCPKEKKNEYILYARNAKKKLKELEDKFKSLS